MPLHRGAQLIPWPNRIAGGRYKFAGAEHQLPLSEPDLGNALHGLVVWESWRTVLHVRDRVVMAHRVQPRQGYPWRLDITLDYTVGPDGLRCTVEAVNSGDEAAPYGYGAHPYLTAGDDPIDSWSVEVPAERYLETDPKTQLPTELRSVADTDHDFRVPRQLGATKLDHAYTDLVRDTSGTATVRLLSATGTGVELSWPRTCSWVQIYTSDRPEPENNRVGVAVEPMTCPPDAFNSGTDLVVIEPGNNHRTNWTIRAV